ncbi:Kinetochore protein NDC80 [Nakaseomyces bracarensis]|uniref:Kinetochore protein NDC80 n=1 Tax=Nakaseomyces bracarensis TaxID=273131 RepID=A0ABR4NTI0_9SACH
MHDERGEENSVLSRLNPHQFTSQIPQHPLSQNIQKRRNSASNGLSDMIMNSITKQAVPNNGNISKNTKRYMRSTVTGASGVLPSGTSRGKMSHSELPSNLRASLPAIERDIASSTQNRHVAPSQQYTSARDPRPLRDRNFQSAIQQEIFDYLTQNKFDIEMNFPISLKTLKQPTQKSFVVIFKWLYSRLDPGYVFTKSIEYEVYQVLKILQYPYLETINKSQISAVGGSGWPKFLGMIHWLVIINTKLDKCLAKLDQNLLNQQTEEVTTLSKPVENIEDQDVRLEKYELMVERLFIDYITESYKTFLSLKDDYSEHMSELEHGFDRFLHVIKLDIDNIQIQNESSFKLFETTKKRIEELKIAREKSLALNGDVGKFQEYIDTMKSKSEEWPTKLENIEEELNEKRTSIKTINDEILTLEQSLQSKGLSVEQIEEKNNEKTSLTKELSEIAEAADELVSQVKSKKIETEKIYHTFQDSIRQYNEILLDFASLRSALNHRTNTEELKIHLPEHISVPNTQSPLTINQLFPDMSSMKDNYKLKLSLLNEQIISRIEDMKVENGNLESIIQTISEEINVKSKSNDNLEVMLSKMNTDLKNVKQENRTHILSQNLEIEKLERQILDGNKNLESKLAEAENQVKQLEEDKRDLIDKNDAVKNELSKKIKKLIEEANELRSSVKDSTSRLNEVIIKELEELEI